tara:strand:- start:192 stop:695 length:504 start_codon:yes stop_codon:yes gene_type:complete
MAWERLYTNKLTGTGQSIDTGVAGITAKKHLRIEINVIQTGSSQNNIALRFNGDTGTNYPLRRSTNGAADSTFTTNYAFWYNGYGGSNTNRYAILDILNESSSEKLIIHNQVIFDSTGAGTAPTRIETVSKWVNTSAQITDVELNSGQFDAAGLFGIGTEMTIFGTD